MTDDFLTKGLENDRYLKAFRLIEQFEDEIETRLLECERRMVEQQPSLFDLSSDPYTKKSRSPSSGFANHRVYRPMDGSEAPGGDERLHVHLYWMPPTEYNRVDIDTAVRGFGYKIKGADADRDDEVVSNMRDGDWSIEPTDNPYDSNTVFYNHVSSTTEIEATTDELVDHFSEFGHIYGARPDARS